MKSLPASWVRWLPFTTAVLAFVYWQSLTPLQLTTRYGTSDPDETLNDWRFGLDKDGPCDLRGDVLAPDGEPVVGALVTLSSVSPHSTRPEIQIARTDLRGHWRVGLDDLAPRRVSITTPLFLPAVGQVACNERSLTTRMTPGGVLLRGVVQGEAADHLGDVAVLLSPERTVGGPFFAAFTDRHGVYWLRVERGEYEVFTHRQGYATPTRHAAIVGELNRVDFWLTRSAAVEGRLIGDGPLAGAPVTALARPALGSAATRRIETTTRRDGSFVLDGLPAGPFELEARTAAGVARKVVYPTPLAGEPVTLSVEPGSLDSSTPAQTPASSAEAPAPTRTGTATLSGTVLTTLNEPIGTAWLTLERVPVVHEARPIEQRTPLRADGSFQISGLSAGRYALRLSTPLGPRPWASEVPLIELAEREHRSHLTLVADACVVNIGGKVVNRVGRPVGGATIWAQPALPFLGNADLPDGSSRVGASMADGRFVLPSLCPGLYQISALAEGGRLRAHLDLPAGTVKLVQLVETGALGGRVLLQGQPVRNYRVNVSGVTSRELEVMSSDGRFSVQQLEPGEYQVLIRTSSGYAFARVVVNAGQQQDEAMEILPFRELHGRLVEHDGTPVADARIAFWHDFPEAATDFSFARDGARRVSPLSALVTRARSGESGEFTLMGLVSAAGQLSFETAQGPLLVAGSKLETALGTLGGPGFTLPVAPWSQSRGEVGDVEVVRR